MIVACLRVRDTMNWTKNVAWRSDEITNWNKDIFCDVPSGRNSYWQPLSLPGLSEDEFPQGIISLANTNVGSRMEKKWAHSPYNFKCEGHVCKAIGLNLFSSLSLYLQNEVDKVCFLLSLHQVVAHEPHDSCSNIRHTFSIDKTMRSVTKTHISLGAHDTAHSWYIIQMVQSTPWRK